MNKILSKRLFNAKEQILNIASGDLALKQEVFQHKKSYMQLLDIYDALTLT